MKSRRLSSPEEPLVSFMVGTPVSRQLYTENVRLFPSFCGIDTKRINLTVFGLELPLQRIRVASPLRVNKH